jgi:hypothetical protein
VAPEFVRVTGTALLLLPTACDGKLIEPGEKLVPGTDTVVLIRTKIP